MKIFLGGARGSSPVSGRDFVRYGGDTFSLLVEDRDGAQVLIDAGSGVRRLQKQLRPDALLFFTHTHLDHLLGLPLLEALRPRQMLFPRGGLEEVLERVFSPPIWPVRLPKVEISIPVAPVTAGGLKIHWQPVAHPDGCVAYRLDEPATGASVVVATDIEWLAMSEAEQSAFVEFAKGADLMVFDAQFRPAEYEAHKGWGHSTWKEAVDVAQQCGVHKLWLMHHSPERTDAELDEMSAAVSAAFPGAIFPTIEQMMEALHE